MNQAVTIGEVVKVVAAIGGIVIILAIAAAFLKAMASGWDH
jgi:hypothetical protein